MSKSVFVALASAGALVVSVACVQAAPKHSSAAPSFSHNKGNIANVTQKGHSNSSIVSQDSAGSINTQGGTNNSTVAVAGKDNKVGNSKGDGGITLNGGSGGNTAGPVVSAP